MIQGKKTSDEYFATELDSASSLKLFSQDRRAYFKKFCLKEKVEEEKTQASMIGSLVDCLLLEPELFDSRFYMSSTAKVISGKMGDFINALVDITIANTDLEGSVSKTFEEMATEARKIAQFDWSLEVILKKFVGQDPEILYKELREVKSKGLVVITLQDVQNAEKVVEELKTNEITTEIVNLVNSDRYEVYNQLPVEGYEIDGLNLKSLLDKVIVDHKEKNINPYDLKVVWSTEGFYTEYYLYRLAYIQAYLYYAACRFHFKDLVEQGYRVNYLNFLVADSINYYSPLIYTLNQGDMSDAYLGFEYKGRKYEGVKDIIKNLIWTKKEDKWRISRNNYLKGGIINIKE